MANTVIPMGEKKWREESDARTLAEAQEIMADKKRLAAATKRAQTLAQEKQKEASAMKKVAGKKPTKKK